MIFVRLFAVYAFFSLCTSAQSQIWSEEQKLISSDIESNDNFGRSVSISGNYAIIGAEQESDWEEELVSAGAAYIFKRNEMGEWAELQKLTASDRTDFAWFGWSVGISGPHIVISASHAETIYIFEQQENGFWEEVKKITPSEESPGFGKSVSISNDRIVVATNAEKFYIYERSSEEWSEVQVISSQVEAPIAFGQSVSVSGDYIFTGAYTEGNYKGAVYIFKRDETGFWNQTQKIISSRPTESDSFGFSIDVNGPNAIVGAISRGLILAPGFSVGDAGGADIYELDEFGTWQFVKDIQPSDVTLQTSFGMAVAIAEKYAIGGTYHEKWDENGSNELSFAGAAYIFQRIENGNWSEIKKIVPSDRHFQDRFASSVDIEKNLVLAGAPYKVESTSHGDEFFGAAYFFQACEEDIQTISVCETSYTWSVNGETYTEAGTYHAESSTEGNCTAHTLNLTFPEVNTQVTQHNNTLVAEATSATFQWLDCNDEMADIEGETDATFAVGENGSYAVEVTQHGCTKTSDCFPVIYLGISEDDLTAALSVYPNPTVSTVTVHFNKTMTNVALTLVDILGKPIVKQQYSSIKEASVTIPGEKGLYLIRISAGGQSTIRKIIKQ